MTLYIAADFGLMLFSLGFRLHVTSSDTWALFFSHVNTMGLLGHCPTPPLHQTIPL